tara:strand:+ start:914 stop:1282 length:369 start_codon:yes stop_codon:yes gene_type:complete
MGCHETLGRGGREPGNGKLRRTNDMDKEKNTITNQNVLRYFTRLNNDVNGNPRYKITACDLADIAGIEYNASENAYVDLVKSARKAGAGKLNTKHHPYSIKVTSYNIVRTLEHLVEKLQKSL